MMNKLTFEAVDRTFRDLMEQVDQRNKNLLIGGICIVFRGDFRQVPPVIRHGNRAAIVSASNAHTYGNIFRQYNLKRICELETVLIQLNLMETGEVRALCIWDSVSVDSRVYIPKQWVILFDAKKLIEQVYGDFSSQHSNSNY